jgi:hypothetical protein
VNPAIHYPAVGATFPGIKDAARALGITEYQVKKQLERGDAVRVPIHFVFANSEREKTQPKSP